MIDRKRPRHRRAAAARRGTLPVMSPAPAVRWLVPCALALTGCPGDDAAATDAGVDASPTCLEANEHSDLPWLQEKVFTPQCSNFGPCHRGTASMAKNLNLEAGRTRAALVDVASMTVPSWKLVTPGDPARSFLMVTLGQYPSPTANLVTMPFNSPLLCREKRDAIERWIAAGAPETAVDAGIDGP